MAEIVKEMKNQKRGNTKAAFFVFLLFLLLFPYLLSLFREGERQTLSLEEEPGLVWVQKKELWGHRRIPLEEYLVGMVAATIPAEYEMEALKAQAIVLRSHCMTLLKKEEGRKIIDEEEIKEYYFSPAECESLWGENTEIFLRKTKKAVDETEGKILLYGEQIISPPFFRSGNGKTRDVKDYPVQTKELAYLKSAECPQDINSEAYITYIEISGEEFIRHVEKLKGEKSDTIGKITLLRDSTGYVKEVRLGESRISTEEFRRAFSIPSSCFGIEKINHRIQFKIMGKGHGFGFSQHQANELARQGSGVQELIAYFFKDVSIERI